MHLGSRKNACTLATSILLAAALALPAGASVWSGSSGNWSSDGNPGWNGTGVPNGIGAVATFSAGSLNVTNDVNPTLGTIERTGSSSGTPQVVGGTITMNQDGAGSGHATISNSSTDTGSTRLGFSSALTLVLADDLLFSNTSATTGSYSIGLSSKITGSGNVTVYNELNSASVGSVSLSGASDFTGSVLVQKGALTFTNTALGNASNVVTLGSAGNGSATLMSTGSNTNLQSDVVVASGTGGTLLLGSNHASSTATSTFGGGITLNDNLSITSVKPAGGIVAFTGNVSGVGGLTKVGSGEATLEGVNTYAGDTVVSEGTLTIVDGSELRFNIEDGGNSNGVQGTATVSFDGLFRIDISALNDTAGTWNIVDVGSLTESFGSNFGLAFVGGPSFSNDGGGLYSSSDWQFSTATGNLTLVPEPASMLLMAIGGALLYRRRA